MSDAHSTDPYADTIVLPRVRVERLQAQRPTRALDLLAPLGASPAPLEGRRRRGSRWVAAAGVALVVGLGVAGGLLALNHKTPADLVRHFEPNPNGVAPDGVGDIEHLQTKMRSAIKRAITAAEADGVALRVTSGWRSAQHQQELYDEAIEKYGSPEAARKWVLPSDESAHVEGLAVDVGPATGAKWLDRNGERFGLCRRYANEAWHFERLAGAKGSTCPGLEPHA